MFIKLQEIYLSPNSEYKNTDYPVYIAIDKIISITPVNVKDFDKKCFVIRLVDSNHYKCHSTDIEEMIAKLKVGK